MSNTTNINKIYPNLSLDELLYIRNQVNIKKWRAYKIFTEQDSIETELNRVIEEKCKHKWEIDYGTFDPCRTCKVCSNCGMSR